MSSKRYIDEFKIEAVKQISNADKNQQRFLLVMLLDIFVGYTWCYRLDNETEKPIALQFNGGQGSQLD